MLLLNFQPGLTVQAMLTTLFLCTRVQTGSDGCPVKKTGNVILNNSGIEVGEEIATLALALICLYMLTLALIAKEGN